MKIRHLAIRNFRGIKQLDWHIFQSMVCLIGRGDSSKSTILEAINLVLSSRWTMAFTDADFYNSDITKAIEVIVSVGELPKELITQEKYGNYLRGWTKETGLVDEPIDGTEPVLSIALRVDQSLEPNWLVVNDREPEGVAIHYSERKILGATWLGTYVDQDLSWGRNSALSKLASRDSGASGVLAEAGRKAREAVATASLEILNESAKKAGKAAKIFGVHPKNDFSVGLDAKSNVAGQATLTLHDGQVPARMAGLGSRRLLTLAIQHESVPEGGIMLIDEVEFGLEPHRLRHLLRKLRPEVNANQQVFLTTHSRVSIEELNSDELHIVHNTEGIVDIKCAGGDLQNLMRKAPEAFLSTKVLACEGLTEVGFVRHLDNAWQSKDNGTAFAYIGVVPTTSEKGGGKDMPAVALAFKRLGFEVAYLCDSDDELSPSADDLRASGITVVQWEGGLCIEQRIAQDMPFEGGLDDFVAAAVENKAEDGMDASGIYDSISSELNVESGKFTGKVSVLKEMGKSEEEIRKAIGERANKGKWFKRISAAERLCAVVLKHESAIENSDLIKKINMVKEWVYA